MLTVKCIILFMCLSDNGTSEGYRVTETSPTSEKPGE